MRDDDEFRFTLALDHCTRDTAARTGGKAIGLGLLSALGLPSAPGFVITTDAYRHAVESAGLTSKIAALLANVDDHEAASAASKEIKSLFGELDLPGDVRSAIERAHREHDGEAAYAFAVRSSATAEDLPNASFAGQQDTFLGVRGVDDIVRRTIDCWASLFNPHAIEYRARIGIGRGDVAMAVVVQRLVPADSAGVMMTLDPQSGRRSVVCIEAALGLGEGVVRGDITPDRFVVDKGSMRTTLQEVATKVQAYRSSPSGAGVRLVDVPEEQQNLAALTPDEVTVLAQIGVEAEAAFGAPLDIEWAIAADPASGEREVYLLQARPETVWSQRSETESADCPTAKESWNPLHGSSPDTTYWTRANVGEAAPGVLTPLCWSIWWQGMERASRLTLYRMGVFNRAEAKTPPTPDDGYIRIFYGRPAIKVDFVACVGDRMPGTTGREAAQSILGHAPVSLDYAPTRRRYPILAWRLPYTFLSVPRQLRALAAAADTWRPIQLRRVGGLDTAGSNALLKEAAGRFEDAVAVQVIMVFAVVQPLYDIVGRMGRRAGIDDITGLTGSGNAEFVVPVDLWRVAHGELTLEEMVRLHGFHGPMEGEISAKVWREDDAPLRRVVGEYFNREDPREKEVEAAVRAKVLRQQVLAAFPKYQRPAIRFVLAVAARRIPLRGVAKRSFLQTLDVARAAARRLGECLVADGVLDDPEDVFLLTLDELTKAIPANVRDLVDRRKERRKTYQNVFVPGQFQGSPTPLPLTDDAHHEPGEIVLEGVGVSAGVALGTVRVVTDPSFAEVGVDEILVAHSTDPSWSSVMYVSSALIVDIGGALSHAAIVAREMGIPCVVNTRTGTRKLRNGDRVRVDGSAGTVELLEHASNEKVANR